MIKKRKKLKVNALFAAVIMTFITASPIYAVEAKPEVSENEAEEYENDQVIEITEYGIVITKSCEEAINQKLYTGKMEYGSYLPCGGNTIKITTNGYMDPDEICQNEFVKEAKCIAEFPDGNYWYSVNFVSILFSIREKAALFAEDERIIRIEPEYWDPIDAFNDHYITFQDVNNDMYYSKAISWASHSGIARGYKGEIFGVGRSCTRKEFLIFLWRFKGRQESDYSNKSDTYRAIEWATSKGIVKGYKDGDLHLDDTINRKDALIMLYRTIRSNVTTDVEFPDVLSLGYSKDSDTYCAIAWAEEMGITHGYSDGTFRPFEECLREQCVTFLFRATLKGYKNY